MHIPDLDLCRYHGGPFNADNWAVPLQAVGWLEHPHAFPSGAVPSALIPKLKMMVEQSRSIYSQLCFRGVKSCTQCIAAGLKSPGPVWSQENIFVPGDRAVYVAPGGIIHYVEVHSYLPPQAFMQAVLACPEVASAAYREALRAANRGIEPPLETGEESTREFRRKIELRQSLKKDPANLDLADQCWASLRGKRGEPDVRSGRTVVNIYRASALASKAGVVALARAYRELFEVSGESPRLAYFDELLIQAVKSCVSQLSEQERSIVQWVLQSMNSA